MAGGEIDAFLAFGPRLESGKAPWMKIEGETHDIIEQKEEEGLARSIQIKSYNMGFNVNTEHTEGTHDQGDVVDSAWQAGEITIQKYVDAASPKLLEAMSKGCRYDYCAISQRKAGGQKGKSGSYFWFIVFADVAISKLSWNAEDGPSTETLTLTFYGNVWAKYWKQKPTGEVESNPIEGAAEHDTSRKPDKGDGADKPGNGAGLTEQQIRKLVRDEMDKQRKLQPARAH
jgi:type VI protein secretion system component Hcp